MGTGIKKPLFREQNTRDLLPLATFDIETELIGSSLNPEFLDSCVTYGNGVYHHLPSREKLAEFLLDHPGYRYYAHNGAGFDFTYLIDSLTEMIVQRGITCEPIVQGTSRLIGLILKKGRTYRLEIRDSLPLLPMSLKQASAMFAPDYAKQDIGLSEGVTYDKENPLHIEYLHRDVDALFHVLTNFSERIFALFGVHIGFTAGSTALYCWQAHIPEGHAYYRMNQEAENFCRRAYYGGYVYPGKSIQPHIDEIAIDFNAAYAAIMREGVPYGTPAYTGEFNENRPGIYHCLVYIPQDVPFPPIPSRSSRGELRWATGYVDTYITSEEIHFARKLGCECDVIDGYVFPKIEYPFNAFLDKCEQLELEQGGAAKEVCKLMRNSLYGKFGSKPVHQKIHFLADGVLQLDMEPCLNEDTGELNPYIGFTLEVSQSNYIMPHWAVWITAGQRIKLLSVFLELGAENVHYGDTDCAIGPKEKVMALVEQGKLSVGRKYGQVKVEKEYRVFQSLGPKNYHGIDINGRYFGKVKGIPRRLLSEAYYNLLQPLTLLPENERLYCMVPIYFDSVTSSYMKLKHPNKNIATRRKRKLSSLENSASWILKGTDIKPLHFSQKTVQ